MRKKKTWSKRKNYTDHHVPPVSTYAKWFGFILRKKDNEHVAYHILFGNVATYEECCRILKKHWWTRPKEGKRK